MLQENHGTYGVTSEFLRIFGFGNLNELPDLPRYKIDENQQIVIDEIIEEEKEKENIDEDEKGKENE